MVVDEFVVVGFFDAGDRYRLIAGHVLIGHEQLEVEEPHLDGLRIDAGVFIFEVLGVDDIAAASVSRPVA